MNHETKKHKIQYKITKKQNINNEMTKNHKHYNKTHDTKSITKNNSTMI